MNLASKIVTMAGMAVFVAGVALLSVPAAVAVAGMLLMVVGLTDLSG